MLQRRYQEAIADFEHARELNATSTTPDLGLAQVHLAQGNHERAVSLLQKQPKAAINLFWLSRLMLQKAIKRRLWRRCKNARRQFRDFTPLDASPYFSALRSDPRYQQLIQHYRKIMRSMYRGSLASGTTA